VKQPSTKLLSTLALQSLLLSVLALQSLLL
jgi:hypothetical protein